MNACICGQPTLPGEMWCASCMAAWDGYESDEPTCTRCGDLLTDDAGDSELCVGCQEQFMTERAVA